MSESELTLSLDDIEYLKTVREINERPEDFPDDWTDGGEVPATTTAIREATDLSNQQVQYRSGSSGGRGFESAGVIIVHDPPLNAQGFGPKSVELTEEGRELLESELERRGMTEGNAMASPATAAVDEQALDELEERVANLETAVEDLMEIVEAVEDIQELRDDVQRWGEDEFGAVDEETAARLRTVLNYFPLFNIVFEEVLGVDMDALDERRDELTEDDLARIQADVIEQLRADGTGTPTAAGDVEE